MKLVALNNINSSTCNDNNDEMSAKMGNAATKFVNPRSYYAVLSCQSISLKGKIKIHNGWAPHIKFFASF